MRKKTAQHDYKLEKHDYFSVMIVPPYGKESWQLKFSKFKLTLLVSSMLVLVLVFLLSAFYLYSQSFTHRQVAALKLQTKRQERLLTKYKEEIQAIQFSLKNLWQKSDKMKRDLGGKKSRRKKYRRRQSNQYKFEKKWKALSKKKQSDSMMMVSKLDLVKTELLSLERQTLKNEKKLAYFKKRFASTPSIWPVYGYIRSNYGWRIHPLTGRSQFHKGVDIPSWIGSPVKATADGVVEFSGWGGGYGWLIIVAHDYGYRTIYAHLSDLLVSTGRQIKKGEIIGKIGKSGMSTGPHVHYEVRRWRRSTSPTAYLNLDLYTAVTKLW